MFFLKKIKDIKKEFAFETFKKKNIIQLEMIALGRI
jgi:hypothetical protein